MALPILPADDVTQGNHAEPLPFLGLRLVARIVDRCLRLNRHGLFHVARKGAKQEAVITALCFCNEADGSESRPYPCQVVAVSGWRLGAQRDRLGRDAVPTLPEAGCGGWRRAGGNKGN